MFGDPETHRPKAEVERWRARDPLLIARQRLRERGVAEAEIRRLEAEVDAEVEEAVEFARKSPEPDSAEATRYVYVE